jgi:hypothetical protein
MATVASASDNTRLDHYLYTWTPLSAANPDGAPAYFAGAGDRTVQVSGTFGVSGTVIIEGTLDGSNWYQLKDPLGTLISFTAAGLKAVLENVIAIRPRASVADGSTAITVVLAVRR